MPGQPTPNLGLTVPTVGSDINIWGNELNSDLEIIDTLAVAPAINISSSYNIVPVNAMEQVLQITTGSLALNIGLPLVATFNGKFVTIVKIDSGLGTATIVGLINGQTSWQLSNQWQYVRIYGNGASYVVVGSN